MFFYSCNNSEERQSHNVKPSEDRYQEDTALSGQDKPNARYVELKGERELTQDLSNVDVISIFESDTRTSIYIAKNSKNLDSFKFGMREAVRHDPFAVKIILDELAFVEFREILYKNCITSAVIDLKELDEVSHYHFTYTTGFYVKGQNVGQCFYVYKKNILPYFDAVLSALNNSKWKNQYQGISKFISKERANVDKIGD